MHVNLYTYVHTYMNKISKKIYPARFFFINKGCAVKNQRRTSGFMKTVPSVHTLLVIHPIIHR